MPCGSRLFNVRRDAARSPAIRQRRSIALVGQYPTSDRGSRFDVWRLEARSGPEPDLFAVSPRAGCASNIVSRRQGVHRPGSRAREADHGADARRRPRSVRLRILIDRGGRHVVQVDEIEWLGDPAECPALQTVFGNEGL